MTGYTLFEADSAEGSVPVKVWTDDVDAASAEQLRNLARLPVVQGPIAAMPDVHLGKGATVGSVIPTRGAIIPAAVGVDIGCGMNAVRTSLTATDLPDDLRGVRRAIEQRVPVGRAEHDRRTVEQGPSQRYQRLQAGFERLLDRHPGIATRAIENDKARFQMGTLGGGNHFIEVCLDEAERVWVMLHSGSRGIGNRIGTYFIEQARTAMEQLGVELPDQDLAYLTQGQGLFDDYIDAVMLCQDYAAENRRAMMAATVEALRAALPVPLELTGEAINCHHNYAAREEAFGESVYVTRKGAIRAGEGELGIIPGSMGARSYIVEGKGNKEAWCSCAHGAGRRMSRNAAKRQFSAEDLAAQTRGVECRRDRGVVDEIPGAYKDIDTVMANQRDLVRVRHELRQIVCVKG